MLDHAKRLRARSSLIGSLGLGIIVFSTHWVWALIAGLLTIFLIFALDDEAKELEQQQ